MRQKTHLKLNRVNYGYQIMECDPSSSRVLVVVVDEQKGDQGSDKCFYNATDRMRELEKFYQKLYSYRIKPSVDMLNCLCEAIQRRPYWGYPHRTRKALVARGVFEEYKDANGITQYKLAKL